MSVKSRQPYTHFRFTCMGGRVIVEGLGQNPRGTKFVVHSRRSSPLSRSNAEKKDLMAKYVAELLAETSARGRFPLATPGMGGSE